MNRKLEILLGTLIIISFVGFIGLNLFNTVFDENKSIEKLADAINNVNVDYLKGHIEIEGVKESLTPEQIGNIATLLKEYGIDSYSLENSYGAITDNFYLKKQGKENIIFDKYILVLKPYNISVESNLADTKIYLDNKEIGTIKGDNSNIKYSGVLPGKHKIKAVYKGEYGNLENEEEIICFDRYDNDLYHSINLDAYYVDIFSNMDGAKLYIDGKDTGIRIYNYHSLGPLPLDSNIEIQAKIQIDGKTYESEIYTIDGRPYYELSIDYVEPSYAAEEPEPSSIDEDEYFQNSVVLLMDNYLYGLVNAINNNDFSLVEPYIENNSPLMEAQTGLVDRLYSNGTKEELLQYEVHNIRKVDSNIYEADVVEKHKIIYSNGKEEVVTNQWIYTIVYDGFSMYLRNLRR